MTMRKTKFQAIRKLAVIGSMAAITTVSAASYGDTRYELRVNPAQLNGLENVQSLHDQIQDTARRACPSFGNERDLREMRACREDVVADIVQQINHPLLTAVHLGEDAAVSGQSIAARSEP